jgi:hypothetical protein
MANPYHHAVSSAKKWGGKAEDYQAIHDWFDESKMMMADFRHRALRHHAEGCFMAERIFGHTITNSDGRKVPTRWVAEQHVSEDLGRIPSMQDWFCNLSPQPWMGKTQKLPEESRDYQSMSVDQHDSVNDKRHTFAEDIQDSNPMRSAYGVKGEY